MEIEFWYGLAKLLLVFGGVFIITIIIGYLISHFTEYNVFFGRHELHNVEYKRIKHHINREVKGFVLDMETGIGVSAITAAKKPEVLHVVAVDVDQRNLDIAIENAKSAGVTEKIEFRRGDLFQAIGKEKFDYIILNPPIRSSREYGLIRQFLREAKDYLNSDGRIILRITTYDKDITWDEIKRYYEIKILEKKTWPFWPDLRWYLSLKKRT